MNSKFDWEIMQHAELTLGLLAIPREVKIICPHRTPHLVTEYGESAATRGIKVLIAGGSGAAHTTLPVLGVPIPTDDLKVLMLYYRLFKCQQAFPLAHLA